MSDLEVQRFLRDGGTLTDLTALLDRAAFYSFELTAPENRCGLWAR